MPVRILIVHLGLAAAWGAYRINVPGQDSVILIHASLGQLEREQHIQELLLTWDEEIEYVQSQSA